MRDKRLYARLEKIEDQPDGTLKVWGYASSEATDADGEVVTADAMRAALPDYLKWGAVREMHQAVAAGTAIEAQVQDDGRTWFGAHIVDPDAVKKVQTQVYKGFSIGGNVTGRDPEDPTRITGLRLVEISLVDRPANPESIFTMYKAETPETPAMSALDQLTQLLAQGRVSPQALLALAKAQATPAAPDAAEPPAKPAPQATAQAAPGALAALHKTLRDCHQNLGAACDKLEALAGPGEDKPAATPDAKTPPAPDAPAKADLALALAKLATEHDTLLARLARLEAQPAPGGAQLRVFGKADDSAPAPELAPILTARGQIDEAATLIKMVHRAGGRPMAG